MSEINLHLFEKYIKNELTKFYGNIDDDKNYNCFLKITGLNDKNEAEDKFFKMVDEMISDDKKKISDNK